MIKNNIFTYYKEILLSIGIIFLLVLSWGNSLAQISDDADIEGTVPQSDQVLTKEDLTLYSSTHPDQNKWYADNTIKFIWNKPNHPTGYSYIFNQNSSTVPDNISEGLAQEKTYSDVVDGIWYFHLKALGNSFSPPVLHWKVNIDITPPEFEYLRFKEGDSTTDRTPT
ncbi:MAG: hypothetical protein ABH837_01775, partial [bacterium]